MRTTPVGNLANRLEQSFWASLAETYDPRTPSTPNLGNRTWWPETPSERQREFLAATEREVLYGGAAGGGKSIALLMGALAHVDSPGYAALILRRRMVDLELDGGLIGVSHAWLGRSGLARWSGTHKRWTFNTGATLTFGYLERPDDRFRYQGTQYQYIGFDELTEFGEAEYQWMFRSLRRTRSLDVVPSMRAATNPIGRGRDWVRARFITNATADRKFIPAVIADNPGLEREEYEANLAELPQYEREALLAGNWYGERDTLIRDTWIDAATTPCAWPSHVVPVGHHPTLFVGVDFGRSRDRTVCWTWERVGDVCYARDILVMHKTPFDDQVAAIDQRINRYVVKAAMDAGGIGAPLVERLQRRHGNIVEPMHLSDAVQRRAAERLRAGFEGRRVRIPDDPDLRDDLRLVSLGPGGEVVTKRDPSVGHADRFWAAALGYEPAALRRPVSFAPPVSRPYQRRR